MISAAAAWGVRAIGIPAGSSRNPFLRPPPLGENRPKRAREGPEGTYAERQGGSNTHYISKHGA